MASPQEAKGVEDESVAQRQPSAAADQGNENQDDPKKAESSSAAAAAAAEESAPSSPNSSSQEEGEASPESPNRIAEQQKTGSGGVDDESSAAAPPLPSEPVPERDDDGWEPLWSEEAGAWYFYNRITQKTQWDNPRVPESSSSTAGAATSSADTPAQPPLPLVGGYNPAIHGDYDPNADYAQVYRQSDADAGGETDPSLMYSSGAFFNRTTGKFQQDDEGSERHGDEAKSRRQMNAFFDVDAAANSHDGRSLKAERSGKKPSKAELKMFKEKRRAKKEEKRRAWLRD